MRNFVFAWVALLITVAIFAQQALGIEIGQVAGAFSRMPFPQQFMIGLILLMVLWLVASSGWQAQSLARQELEMSQLRQRLDGFRNATLRADEAQHELGTASQHLISSDPVESIASLQKRLAQSEQVTTLQESRNKSVDMDQRLDEIRRQQHQLRERISQVLENRRASEGVFGELRERQIHIEHSLSAIEAEDSKNNLADRMKAFTAGVHEAQTRINTLHDQLANLNRFGEELDKSKTALLPLQAPQTGVESVVSTVLARRDHLFEAIGKLETSGDQTLIARVDTLAKSKVDSAQRIASLNEAFATLDTLRRDFDELKERREHVDQSLAAVEIDSDGVRLADRLNALNDFAAQARDRLRVVQDALTTLGGYREDLKKSEAQLVPLQAPNDGIAAFINEAHGLRDRLTATLDKLESSGAAENEAKGVVLANRLSTLNDFAGQARDRLRVLQAALTTLGGYREDLKKSEAQLTPLQAQKDGIPALMTEAQGMRDRLVATLGKLESSGAAEAEAAGIVLADRLNALNEFSTRSRERLDVLQSALTTLGGYRENLKKSETQLAPLQAPKDGIPALMIEAHNLRDRLVETLDRLETSGGEALVARVDALAKSKTETENRIATVVDSFSKLDTIRADIGGLFSKLNIAIQKHSS